MRAHPIRAVLLPALAATTLLLAACSEKPGTATSTTTPDNAGQPTESTVTRDNNTLAGLSACELLSENDISMFDFSGPGEDGGAVGG
ncbi:MAG: hypothetical protein ACRDQW_07540, partial [Haloechinothrix sp.]